MFGNLRAMRDGSIAAEFELGIDISPAQHAVEEDAGARGRARYEALVQRVLKSGREFAAGSDLCWFYLPTILKLTDRRLVPLHSANTTRPGAMPVGCMAM